MARPLHPADLGREAWGYRGNAFNTNCSPVPQHINQRSPPLAEGLPGTLPFRGAHHPQLGPLPAYPLLAESVPGGRHIRMNQVAPRSRVFKRALAEEDLPSP